MHKLTRNANKNYIKQQIRRKKRKYKKNVNSKFEQQTFWEISYSYELKHKNPTNEL